jgi:hypothetical protein
VVLALVARYWMWPAGAAAAALAAAAVANAIGVGTTPLRSILRDPARYDGAEVRVRGRVGSDVFPVGGGHTFYLFQGRDSLVVYTRRLVPRPRQGIQLEAQVSTGMLGDEARPALLERLD